MPIVDLMNMNKVLSIKYVSARISMYHSEKFQPQTAATLFSHFMHKKPLNLPPSSFAPADVMGHKCSAVDIPLLKVCLSACQRVSVFKQADIILSDKWPLPLPIVSFIVLT